MAKGLRGRVGKQYKGTQRTRKAVHGEGSVELAKWTFPIISFSREPYEAKVSRTGLTGGMGRRTVRQRALCLPSGNTVARKSGKIPPFHDRVRGFCHGITPLFLPAHGPGAPLALRHAALCLAKRVYRRGLEAIQTSAAAVQAFQRPQAVSWPHPQALLCRL